MSMVKFHRNRIVILVGMLFVLSGCVTPSGGPTTPDWQEGGDPIGDLLDSEQQRLAPLERMGYTIQVGAFTVQENAVRLERSLDGQGIDAYYFRHESGLYKVRFGNYADGEQARKDAEVLQGRGIIGDFYIVSPEDYAVARLPSSGHDGLREEIVKTARRFLGTPYRWGGTDRADGFDCSGLTMVCYRLNGLNLPRVSLSQFQRGVAVSRHQLRKGDLVFFSTNGGGRVSHVGLYIGAGQFIHAPRTGQQVGIESLDHPYYSKAYVAARSYLPL